MKKRIQVFFQKSKETIQHFGWFSLLIIPIFFFINWAFFAAINAQEEAIQIRHLTRAVKEVNNIDLYVNTNIESIHNDFHVVRDANETQMYLNDPIEDNLDDFKALVDRFAANKPNFIQTTIIDSSGQAIYEVNRQGDQLVQTPDDQLALISDQPYFQQLNGLSKPQLYIKQLALSNDIPVLTLIAPFFNEDNQIQCYFQVEVNANQFLNVFNLYASGPDDYLSYGVMTEDNLWTIDEDMVAFDFIDDAQESNKIKERINQDEYASVYAFQLSDGAYDYLIENDQIFELFVFFDMDKAVADSHNYMLMFPWVIIIINMVALVFISYMAVMIRSKNDDRILLNANMYLSAQNQAGVIITDHKLHITYVNSAFEDFYKYRFEDVKSKVPSDVIGITDRSDDFTKDIDIDYESHKWNCSKDDIYILKYLKIRKELNISGKIKHYLGIYTEPRINLNHTILYKEDPYNLVEVIKTLFKHKHFIVNQTCLMLVHVNHADTYAFARYLKGRLDQRYMIAIPQDKYVMIHANIEKHNFNQMIDMMDQIIDVYRHKPSTANNFSSTFVLASSSGDLNTIDRLLQALLVVLEHSKHHPQLKHHIYNKEMDESIKRESQIINQLESAFVMDEFYLLYQVQKNLEDDTLLGVEALLRWKNKKLGHIGPNEFIPIIENSFYINQLTVMVVKKVIQDFSPIYQTLPKGFRVSINLSHFDFSNDYVMDQLVNMIETSALPSRLFTFEITESNYVDNIDKTNRVIELLHKRDILIAIDDFGTGYSSISSLKSIDIDYVKIDKTFIINYPDHDQGDIFKTIVTMVQGLNKEIIVEGTETKAQIDYCLENHCRYAQGFYISKPLTINDMVKKFIHKIPGDKS